MSKSKIFLIVQSALCVLIAVLLSASAIRIFLDGSAWQAAGHPSDWIYTREKAADALAPILPLILASIVMTIIGLVKDIRDEDADKPVQDAEISRDLIAARVPQPSPEMAAERETQKKLRIGGWIGQAPAAKAPAPLVSVSPETARRRILVRRVLMAAAVLFIVLGIFNGSMKDVLIKAIKICTECVGLG